MRYAWIDKTAEVTVAGLNRGGAIVHGSLQIGPGGYASTGTAKVAAAEIPNGTQRLYSTANGVFAVATSGANVLVYKSTDGLAAYALKATLTNATTHWGLPLLVDCGSNRLVLMEYAGTSAGNEWQTSMWGSSDGGENWSLLMKCTLNAIRHFHGGTYDPTTATLYVFTGDGGACNSIVFCADVADLLANPNTWKTRWGLDDNTRSTLDMNYVVGVDAPGSSRFRVTGAPLYGHYMYFGEDVYGAPGGVTVSRMHRTTRAVDYVYVKWHSPLNWAGRAFGELFVAGSDQDGLPLLSAHGRPEAVYRGDTHAHVYRLTDAMTLEEILVIPYVSTYPLIYSLHGIAGYTVVSSYDGSFASVVGKMTPVLRPRLKFSNVSYLLDQTKVRAPVLLRKEDKWALVAEDYGRVLGEGASRLQLENADRLLGEDAATFIGFQNE